MKFKNLRALMLIATLIATLGAAACASSETVAKDDQSAVAEAATEDSESEAQPEEEPAKPDEPNVAVTRVLRADLPLKQGPFPQPWNEKTK